MRLKNQITTGNAVVVTVDRISLLAKQRVRVVGCTAMRKGKKTFTKQAVNAAKGVVAQLINCVVETEVRYW